MNNSTKITECIQDYILFLCANGFPGLNSIAILLKNNKIDLSLLEIQKLHDKTPQQPEINRLYGLLHLLKAHEQETAFGTTFVLNEQNILISSLAMETLPETIETLPLSIVIPVKDERENLPILYEELKHNLKGLGQPYEIIFIDDGSTDGSTEWLEALPAKDPTVRSVIFRRNYGQTAALCAGFKAAKGDIVVTLDADLQNDPADIPMLLSKLSEGYDMVCGWRKQRQDLLLTRRMPSQLANKLINCLIKSTGVYLHDFGCSLKAYKIGITKNIKLYGEMHRFIPVFAAWLGVRIAEVEVNHRPRTLGKTKYGLSRVTRVLFDLLPLRFFSDFMTRPVQFYGKLAIWLMLLGVPLVGLLAVLSAAGIISVAGLLICSMLGMIGLGAVTIVCQGMLGEILIRHYFESQNKDQFVIRRVVEGKKCVE